MNIVFLDIDGVLVTLESFTKYKVSGSHAKAHPDCVAQLNRVLRETGARIVVSSAWRFNGGLGWLRNKFAEWGIHGAKSRTIGMTPNLRTTDNWQEIQRGHEIQAWLEANPIWSAFVILDDDSDMNGLHRFLVQTEFKKGLTAKHADRAIQMLNGVVD